jgi:thiaminase/transcriptional activator TenA
MFSNRLWQKTAPIYQEILNHPFNQELMVGTLARERFLFYMEQDAYYLIGFSRALAFIAGRTPRSKMIQDFLDFSSGALVAERELHASFVPNEDRWDKVEPSPACLGYTQFLIATAAASLEEAVAAVLPCFWIYREVVQAILKHSAANNPYQRWIDTYASLDFEVILSPWFSRLTKCSF